MLSIRTANNVLSLERCSLGASQRLEILWVQVYTHCRVETIHIATVLWLGPVLVICFGPLASLVLCFSPTKIGPA